MPLHGADGHEFCALQELAGIHDTVVRHGFVRKVYGILSMQLIVTFARLASHRPWAWLTVSQAAAVVTSGPRGFSCVYQRLRAPESVTCKSSQPRTTAIAAGRLLCNFNLSMQSTAFDGAHLIVRSRSLDRSCWLRTMRYALQLRQTNPAVIPRLDSEQGWVHRGMRGLPKKWAAGFEQGHQLELEIFLACNAVKFGRGL